MLKHEGHHGERSVRVVDGKAQVQQTPAERQRTIQNLYNVMVRVRYSSLAYFVIAFVALTPPKNETLDGVYIYISVNYFLLLCRAK